MPEPRLIRYGLPVALSVLASAIWWVATRSTLSLVISGALIVLASVNVVFLLPSYVRHSRLSRSEILNVYPTQSDAADAISKAAASARHVDILTVRGLGILGLNGSLLYRTVIESETPRTVRIFLLDPQSDAAWRRAVEIGESVEAFKHGIHLGRTRMEEIADLEHLTLECFYYTSTPCWRIIALDNRMFVSVFDHATEGHESEMYELDPNRPGPIRRALSRMLDDMARSGEQVV